MANDKMKDKLTHNKPVLTPAQQRQKRIEMADRRRARSDRNYAIDTFTSRGFLSAFFVMFIIFLGVVAYVGSKMGMSTFLEIKEVNGQTLYILTLNKYISNITSQSGLFGQVVDNIYGTVPIDYSNIINGIVSIINILIACLNTACLGISFFSAFIPLIGALFGLNVETDSFIHNMSLFVSALHIPYCDMPF